MEIDWDYTKLAKAYLKRPDYAETAINAMLSIADTKKKSKVCDVGAGVAHLTLMLASREMDVIAVEPNDAMRAIGMDRTVNMDNVRWHKGTGENTEQSDRVFDMVTFGSSFNVCDRQIALKETARILKPHGWFVCMWNHRVLEDPIQSSIEKIIKSYVLTYDYGARREDQTKVIEASGLFEPVIGLNSRVVHEQTISECVEAWRSHATLERQAGASFPAVVNAIEEYLIGLKRNVIQIPYCTNIWLARLQ